MNNFENIEINPLNLKFIQEIYEKLSKGYHFCIDDNKSENSGIYAELISNLPYYKQLFQLLGYTLSDGTAGIYYFEPVKSGSALNRPGREMTLFLAILYDYLADQGHDPITAILEIRFYLHKLPHLTVDHYKKTMEAIGVDDDKKLMTIIRRFKKHGFLEIENDSILFKQSVARFTTLFAEYKEPRLPIIEPFEEEEIDDQ